MALKKKERVDEMDRSMAVLLNIGSTCLFHRSPEMSLLQNAIGLVLDDCGATDEVLVHAKCQWPRLALVY
jgi:hypothetical protein